MEHWLSVIIPVYGVAKYLPACLDSVTRQTARDFSIILVDDGSVDGSGEICDEYAASDDRITVIHQKNGGRSSARNTGIAAAETDWIWFVDGDDTITPDSVERLKKAADIGGEMVLFDNTGNYFEPRRLTPREIEQFPMVVLSKKTEGIDADCRFLFGCREGHITYKLFRREFIERIGLHFNPKFISGQDLIFSYTALLQLKEATVIGGRFYEYNINDNSISYRFNSNIPAMYLVLCTEIRRLVESRGNEYLARYYMFVFHKIKESLRLYFGRSDNPKPKKQLAQEFRQYMREPLYRDALLHHDRKSSGFKLNCFAVLCRIGSIGLIKLAFPNLCDI